MNDRFFGKSSSAPAQTKALASAIVLRNCSLQDDVSSLVRRAYRTQMRTQAINWRRTPGNATVSHG